VAIIGIAEKGSVTLTLRVEGPGGHSSTPPERTNIGILARAITRLEDDPFPARLSGVAREMLAFLAPEMGFLERMALSNLWLFEPLVTEMTGKSLEGLAMLHTTSAATMIDGGFKSNVLPTEASAEVNFRILPGETPETVAERVRTVIDDDRVQVLGGDGGRPPSPISDPHSAAFALIGRTTREVAGLDVLVAPYLVIAGTDSRYFAKRSDNVFRFLPVLFEEGGMSRVHGTNERLAVASYPISIRFFYRLIRKSDDLP
jgi:carboxypeptidase PM20D1